MVLYLLSRTVRYACQKSNTGRQFLQLAHFLILMGIMCTPLQFLPHSLALLPGASLLENLRRSGHSLFDELVNPHAAHEHIPVIPVNSSLAHNTQAVLPPHLYRPLAAESGTRPFTPARREQCTTDGRRKTPLRQEQNASQSRTEQRLHAVA